MGDVEEAQKRTKQLEREFKATLQKHNGSV